MSCHLAGSNGKLFVLDGKCQMALAAKVGKAKVEWRPTRPSAKRSHSVWISTDLEP